MNFRSKRIFLADDSQGRREVVRQALLDAGHQVVVEASSGSEALILIDQAVEKEVEIAVLDCNMPNEDDGKNVAEALNRRIPKLIVASISSSWTGVWRDPNFNKDKPYHPDLKGYDENGRREYKGPDLDSTFFYDLGLFIERLGVIEFALQKQEELERLPRTLEFAQRKRRGRERE